jgi:signal transduction histidine kinase
LGADAAVILATTASGSTVLLGECGLPTGRGADLVAAVGSTRRHAATTRRILVSGFEAAIVGDAMLADGASVAACALLFDRSDFQNPELIRAFAAQAALAVEVGEPAIADPARTGGPDAGMSALPFVHGLGYEELILAVMRDIAAVIGPTKVGLYVWDDDKEILQMVPGSFGTDLEVISLGRTTPQDWRCSVARVFATGRPYLTNSAQSDPGVLEELAKRIGLSRLLVMPLHADGNAVGVLELADKAGPFSADDVRVVDPLREGVAQALMFTRIRSQLLRRQRLDALLIDVAINIASGKSLQEFLGAAFDEFCSAAYAAVVALVPQYGEPRIWRQGEERPAVESAFIAEARDAITERAKVVSPERPGDAGWAAIDIPVQAAGSRVGTLAALRPYGVAFNLDERRTLSHFASLIALAWATDEYQNQRAVLARQFERERIGDALHDRIAQLMFAARLHIEAAARTPGVPPTALDSVTQARSLALSAENAVRTVIDELSKPTPEEVQELLSGVVTAVEDEFGRSVKLKVTPAAAAATARIESSAADLLVKVAREALVNAAKHAGPCQISVRLALEARNRLLLAVSDDGIGARPSSDGHGLASLRRAVRRHAGTLRVKVGDAGGTTVSLTLPL